MIERMKRLDRKLMYQGSILDVYKDTMEFPNGTHEEWDMSLIHISEPTRRSDKSRMPSSA